MSDTRVLQLTDCLIDLDASEVRRGSERLILSEQEVGIIETLMAAGERTVSQADLYRDVWGYRGAPRGRAATFAVFRLRKKLEREPTEPVHLLTVRGRGFRLIGVKTMEGEIETHPLVTEEIPRSAIPESVRRTNIMEPEPPFVGREDTLTRIAEALESGQLVSLVGPAGTGKTRLSQRAAMVEVASGRYPGGVWFCDLVEARDTQDVLRIVEGELGQTALSELEDDDRAQALGSGLGGRAPTLLVLDNCEQVIDAVSALIGAWCRAAPQCRFILTSRERCRLPEENVISVVPLDSVEGAQLFVERARTVRPGFVIRPEDEAALAAIVSELDGLPLALELAAGRIRMMPLRQLRERLDRRFDLLRDGSSRGSRSKESTLRGALDWSWDLLEPWEQSVWMQATVFRGGFGCVAAESVIDLDHLPDAPWVVDVLEGLLAKSLLVLDEDEFEPRFRMLVSVREYGQHRRETMPERQQERLHNRHAQFFARMGAEVELDRLRRHGGVDVRRDRNRDLDNLLAAVRWALSTKDAVTAGQAALAAIDLMTTVGPFALAQSLSERVLAWELPRPLTARLLLARSASRMVAGQLKDAMDDAAEAEQLARTTSLQRIVGRAKGLRGRIAQRGGQMDEAAECFDDALRIHRMEDDPHAEAERLGQRGMLHLHREQFDAAQADLEAALRLHRELGDRVAEGSTLGNLATLRDAMGHRLEARTLVEEALAIAQVVGNRRVEAVLLNNLGLLLWGTGKDDQVASLFEASMNLAEALGDTQQQGLATGNLAYHYSAVGNHDGARRNFLRALALDRRSGNRRSECVTLGNLGDFYFGQAEMDAAYESLRDSVAMAEQLGYRTAQGAFGATLAWVEVLRGDIEQGRTRIAESVALLKAAKNTGELFKARCRQGEIGLRLGESVDALVQALEGELTEMGSAASGELKAAFARLHGAWTAQD